MHQDMPWCDGILWALPVSFRKISVLEMHRDREEVVRVSCVFALCDRMDQHMHMYHCVCGLGLSHFGSSLRGRQCVVETGG